MPAGIWTCTVGGADGCVPFIGTIALVSSTCGGGNGTAADNTVPGVIPEGRVRVNGPLGP